MPIETIKCKECGSAEVTEFKPGSYVCGHCEAVFKHVSPSVASGGCEIDGCGVPAVGRCSTCGGRFCATHQARDMKGLYVDWCSTCQAAQDAVGRQKAIDRRQALQRTLESIADPTERLVTALRLLCTVSSSQIHVKDLDVLSRVCPELWPSPRPVMTPKLGNFAFGDNPTWDGRAVARWFASRADSIGVKPDGSVRWRICGKTVFGKYKVMEGASEPAWVFREGSTYRNRCEEFENAYIFPDGRLMLEDVVHSASAHNLRGIGLVRMAELLDLPRSAPNLPA